MFSSSFHYFFYLFYRPAKTDVCDYCTEVTLKIQGAESHQLKTKLQAQLESHEQQAKAQQSHLSEREKSCPSDDKNEEDAWLTIATDLQQTQPVPKLNNQSAFYKKKVRIRFIFF